mmetsp:Transcript_28503/g.32956  ORF Transcript_28503/g.32956 Transcript_28503/m.32956 type:complete len:191 (-) Transcript_28503:401-973(-)
MPPFQSDEQSSPRNDVLGPSKAKEKKQQPEFIRKLLAILQDPACAEIMSWSQCGTHILLKDPNKIMQEVLPTYFNHAKFASLIRQVNLSPFTDLINSITPKLKYFRFKRISSESGEYIYSNPSFQRERPDLLDTIRREKKKRSIEKPSKPMSNMPNQLMTRLESKASVMERLRSENAFMRNFLKETGFFE